MSSIKGGASLDEITNVWQKQLITDDQYKNLLNEIATGALNPDTLTGEWWGAGSL